MVVQQCPMCGQVKDCTHPHWAQPENKNTYLCDVCYKAEVKSGCYNKLYVPTKEHEVITVTMKGRKKKVIVDKDMTNLGGYV